jgi:hypothetical protein
MFYLLSIIYGFVILLSDLGLEDVVITPMMGLWWLLILAFFRPPKEIALIALILLGFVIVSLLDNSLKIIVIRSISFTIGSILAGMVAIEKERVADQMRIIFRIIHLIPAVVIASDSQGTIIAVSDMALTRVSSDYRPLVGHAITDILFGHLKPTTGIATYREWFQRDGIFEVQICLPGSSDRLQKATVECSGKRDSRILVVFIKEKPLA